MSYTDEIFKADKVVNCDKLKEVVKDSIIGEGLVNSISAIGDLANLQSVVSDRVTGNCDDEKLLKALAKAHIALECIQQVSGLTSITVNKAINVEVANCSKKPIDI